MYMFIENKILHFLVYIKSVSVLIYINFISTAATETHLKVYSKGNCLLLNQKTGAAFQK